MKTNLVLLGYRGAGKSYFSKILSQKLNLAIFSSDEEVEKKIGLPIKKWVVLNGWEKFREIEREVLKTNLHLINHLYDLGGGAILHGDILDELKKKSIFCYIQVSLAELVRRLKKNGKRPSLQSNLSLQNETEQNLSTRQPLYQQYADLTINNTGDFSTVETSINQIINTYQKN